MSYAKLFMGFKDSSNKITYIKQINIVNFNGLNNNANFNFNFSFGGYICYGKDSVNTEYFANLIKSLQANLTALFYKFRETRKIVNRYCIYNPLFTNIPVYVFSSITLSEDKTVISKNNMIEGK